MRIRNIFRADRVVGPYYAFKDSGENFELSQASWDKTGNTEGEFWSVQGGPEGNRTPSGPQISNMNSCVVKSTYLLQPQQLLFLCVKFFLRDSTHVKQFFELF